jgi:thioredoxin-related protein
MDYHCLTAKKLTSSIILLCFLFLNAGYTQEKINWVTWDQVQTMMKKQKRKVVVDLYTDWCGWCKRMDATTFVDPEVVKYINKNYYAIKFNAEQKQDVNFKSRVYKFMPSGNRGVHQLALMITNSQLSYPTFVFMDEDLNTIQPLPGYRNAEEFQLYLKFYSENYYKKPGGWDSYINSSNKKK